MSEYLSTVVNLVTQPVSWAWKMIPDLPKSVAVNTNGTQTLVIKEIHNMLPKDGYIFFRVAGLFGASAVALGAYQFHNIA